MPTVRPFFLSRGGPCKGFIPPEAHAATWLGRIIHPGKPTSATSGTGGSGVLRTFVATQVSGNQETATRLFQLTLGMQAKCECVSEVLDEMGETCRTGTSDPAAAQMARRTRIRNSLLRHPLSEDCHVDIHGEDVFRRPPGGTQLCWQQRRGTHFGLLRCQNKNSGHCKSSHIVPKALDGA